MPQFPQLKTWILPALLFAFLINLASCAKVEWQEYSSLIDAQPFVLEIYPLSESLLEPHPEFTLRFSERIDLDSLQDQAVVLLSNVEEKAFSKTNTFMSALKAGDYSQIPLQFILSSEEQELTLLPESTLEDGIYHLVITPALRSTQGLPFNQSPGESPTLFIARYAIGESALSQLNDESGEESAAPSFGPEPEFLVLQEFLYDGKVSETDGEAFVELFGTPGGDISLYQILFINGDNGAETERITLPPHALIGEDGLFLIADLKTGSKTESAVPGADFLDQFDPQNGPDGIQLLNRNGDLLDSVVYGEGAVAVAESGYDLGEGSPALDVAAGHSLSRSQGLDSNDNASDFIELSTPTPGEL